MKIELLGFGGCPNTPLMRANLQAALAGMGLTFEDVDLEALPPGDRRRGYPAPTVLVDGRDPYRLAADATAAAGIGCRIYPGRVPSVRALTERIAAALPK